MKLVINTIPLHGPKTGISNYIFHICQELQKHHPDFDVAYYYGYFSKNLDQANAVNPLLARIKDTAKSFDLLKKIRRKSLNFLASLYPRWFDLYFEPNFIPLDIKAKNIVTTVHDFSFQIHPNWHPLERIEYFKNNFWKNIGRSNMIVTVSNFIRNQAIQEFGFEADRIRVIPNGFDQELFRPIPAPDTMATRTQLGLPESFILFVGSIEPRKNLLNLLDAYANLAAPLRRDHPLVLAGFKGWENREIMKRLRRLNNSVHYLGFVTDNVLAHLYNLATIFVYPSFYEGFGLPPLEAMACGCPVLTANTSSMPEVCGDAASYASPFDAEEMSHRMAQLLESSADRHVFRDRGLKRATNFAWDKSARAHAELFCFMTGQ